MIIVDMMSRYFVSEADECSSLGFTVKLQFCEWSGENRTFMEGRGEHGEILPNLNQVWLTLFFSLND